MSWPADNVRVMIAEYGEVAAGFGPITFTRPAELSGNWSSTTWAVTGGSPVTWTADGRVSNYKENKIDGTAIQAGDRKLTVLPDDRIGLGVTVTIRGEACQIIPPIRVGPMNEYLILQVRKP